MGKQVMNKEYLKYAITLWAIGIPCLFAGIMVEHWGFEAIAAVLFITGYILLYVLPESDSHGKNPRQENEPIEENKK
jgi:cytochrome c oxidase assembly factor CtaG